MSHRVLTIPKCFHGKSKLNAESSWSTQASFLRYFWAMEMHMFILNMMRNFGEKSPGKFMTLCFKQTVLCLEVGHPSNFGPFPRGRYLQWQHTYASLETPMYHWCPSSLIPLHFHELWFFTLNLCMQQYLACCFMILTDSRAHHRFVFSSQSVYSLLFLSILSVTSKNFQHFLDFVCFQNNSLSSARRRRRMSFATFLFHFCFPQLVTPLGHRESLWLH